MKYDVSNQNTNLATNPTRGPLVIKSASPLLKCKNLLWLMLPLTAAIGYAAETQPSSMGNFFLSPIADFNVQPLNYSQSHAVNSLVGRELFNLYMTDTNITYPLGLWVDNGGEVTLRNTSTDKVEGQRLVNEVWALKGVTQVKDQFGIHLASTLPPKAVVIR